MYMEKEKIQFVKKEEKKCHIIKQHKKDKL